MNLAINYSTQAAVLVRSGKIKIDYFKTPGWPDLIAEAQRLRPAAVHFSLRTHPDELAYANWDQIAQLKASTGTPYVNLHLQIKNKDFSNYQPDGRGPDWSEKVTERMVASLDIAARHFGADKIIAENVPYHGPGDGIQRQCVEPTIIRDALEKTSCGLLLDISHARIAAHYLGMDEREYISRLPVKQLRELHFTGVHTLGHRLRDHLSALQADWEILDWVLSCIRSGKWARPWLLTFEYGGIGAKFTWRSDTQVIARQIPLLYEMVKHV